MIIKSIKAREILDSRGNPTVEAEVILENGSKGVAAVPSGASTGEHEAVELRDGDMARYGGKGVLKAIANIEGELSQALIGQELDQKTLDEKMIALDGTSNKSRLGANAILGISLAFAKASANEKNIPLYQYFAGLANGGASGTFRLPVPMFNIINGGRHANFATDWQEFMVVPSGLPTFAEQLIAGEKIYTTLRQILESKNLSTKTGDEGGFVPFVSHNTEALDLLVEAIKSAGYEPGSQVAIALDIAASEFKSGENYDLKKEGKIFSSQELITWYEQLISTYPIISIEDGLAEDDWTGWQELTARLGGKINLVGDDLFCTNPARLQKGIAEKVANAIIIKPNQIGTLTETLEVIKIAQTAGYKIVVSHRSGETTDSTIADLAVGIDADFIKSGAPGPAERMAKYNRLAEIEKELAE